MGCESSTSNGKEESSFFGGTKLFSRRGYNTQGVSKQEGKTYFQTFLQKKGKKFSKDLPSWWISWGKKPLDHIVISDDYVKKLQANPELNENAIKIVEPWQL